MGKFIGNTYHMCINYNYLTTVVYESVSETFNDLLQKLLDYKLTSLQFTMIFYRTEESH